MVQVNSTYVRTNVGAVDLQNQPFPESNHLVH